MANIVTTQADELRAFFARVRPCYRELFNMAHAICGNYELAEYAVQSALLAIFRQGSPRSHVGLRESLRASVRRTALEQVRLIDDAELTWDGFCEDAIEGAQNDPVLSAASQESTDVRRMLMLRYGCGLRAREIARLADISPAQVTQTLTRFERRVRRRLPSRERARVERSIERSALAWLRERNDGVPDPGAVLRSLEAELVENDAPGGKISRAAFGALSLLLGVLLACLFWLLMVLLAPPQLEEPDAVPAPDFMPAATEAAAPDPASGQSEPVAPAPDDGSLVPAETASNQPPLAAGFAPAETAPAVSEATPAPFSAVE